MAVRGVSIVEQIMVQPWLGVLHGRVNGSFVAGRDAVAVIDTMHSPADARHIASWVRQHSAAPVGMVVNTHHHADHCFGNQVFGAPVVSSEICRRIMAGNLDNEWAPDRLAEWQQAAGGSGLEGLRIKLPTITFARGCNLFLGPCPGGGSELRLELLHTGGHSPGHAIVLLPDHGIVFSGDLLFVGRYPFARQANPSDWISALQRIKRMRPEIVIPGHGPVCDASRAQEEADRHISYLSETTGLIEERLEKGMEREAILADAAAFPRFADDGYERLHVANIAGLLDRILSSRRGDAGAR